MNSYKKLMAAFSLLVMPHAAFAEQTLITFSEIVGSDVVVDTQYASQGILFFASAAIGTATEVPNCRTIPQTLPDSGITYYGFSSPPALRCRHPALYYPTDPDVGIIARFFDYEVIPRERTYARKVSFDLIIVTGSQATITTYTANDNVKESVTVRGAGFHKVELPGVMHKFHVSVADSNSKFGIDNVSFELLRLKIEKPKANQQFPLDKNNYRETEIEYLANILDRAVEFNTELTYQTSQGGRGQPSPNPLTESFQAIETGPVKRTYTAKGGKLTVKAKFSEDGVSSVAKPVTAYIVGTRIPNATITARLLALYPRGTTPDLLAKIAVQESGYAQYRSLPLFGVTALWPNESGQDGGSHIGLMQVDTTYERAWDWMLNTEAGANTFIRDKLPAAGRIEARIRRGSARFGIPGRPGLRPLTDFEIETMAVLLYGPCAPGPNTRPDECPNAQATTHAEQVRRQYYAPICVGGTVVSQRNDLICQGGNWDWTRNTDLNPGGVAYADSVRSRQIPQ